MERGDLRTKCTFVSLSQGCESMIDKQALQHVFYRRNSDLRTFCTLINVLNQLIDLLEPFDMVSCVTYDTICFVYRML